MEKFYIGERIEAGGPLFLIAGPCVIENEELCIKIAQFLKETCSSLKIPFIFKASFDKANRTSAHSFRSPGFEEGLRILRKVRETFDVPVLTDVHESWQVEPVSEHVDILQIPAFLCRQTDLLVAAARSGKPVNIKKGQFMAPEDMAGAVEKVRGSGNPRVLLTERGTTFGYHNLVVDMRALVQMRALGVPVIFDATHSVQTPGGCGSSSGGRREFVGPLARAAAATGIDGLFLEVHPDPDRAFSDGPNSLDFSMVPQLLKEVCAIDRLARQSL